MSRVNNTEKVHFDDAAYQGVLEPLSQEAQEVGHNQSKTSLGLHEVFNKDTLNSLDFVSQTMEMHAVTPSLWNRIISWFWKPETVSPPKTMESAATKNLPLPSIEPINLVPAIDPPEHMPADLEGAKFPGASKKTPLKNVVQSKDIEEILAQMSEQTLESVMFIVFKAMLELEKENAKSTETTFTKYIDYQKLQQNVLQEIKDVLMKDEKIAKRLETVQTYAAAAALLSGVAMAAVSFGLLAPVGGFIGATIGASAGSAFVAAATAVGTIGPPVTAGLTGLTLGSKAYFKRRMQEDQAKHEEFSYKDKYYNSRLDDMRARLWTISEADGAFKEHWIRALKRLDRMRKLVLKK